MTEKRRTKPPHVPTDKSRSEVSALAGFGVVQDEIAKFIGIDSKTLRKHYRNELDIGHIRANAAVARSLFKQATEDGNVAAQIFWMKARAGWREKQDVNVVSEDGSMSPKGRNLDDFYRDISVPTKPSPG